MAPGCITIIGMPSPKRDIIFLDLLFFFNLMDLISCTEPSLIGRIKPLAANLTKPLDVFGTVKFHVHLTIPSVFLRVCQIFRNGATLF